MSGVIDKNGVQWEKCNRCLQWVDIDDLCYREASDEHPYGEDLCPGCFDGTISDEEAEELIAEYHARTEAYIASPEYQAFKARLDAGTWEITKTDYGEVGRFIPAEGT